MGYPEQSRNINTITNIDIDSHYIAIELTTYQLSFPVSIDRYRHSSQPHCAWYLIDGSIHPPYLTMVHADFLALGSDMVSAAL